MCFQHLTFELLKVLQIQSKKTQTGVFDFWQAHLCNSRADEMLELLLFGKEIKVFLDKIIY